MKKKLIALSIAATFALGIFALYGNNHKNVTVSNKVVADTVIVNGIEPPGW